MIKIKTTILGRRNQSRNIMGLDIQFDSELQADLDDKIDFDALFEYDPTLSTVLVEKDTPDEPHIVYLNEVDNLSLVSVGKDGVITAEEAKGAEEVSFDDFDWKKERNQSVIIKYIKFKGEEMYPKKEWVKLSGVSALRKYLNKKNK
jgi:hypothetical protein